MAKVNRRRFVAGTTAFVGGGLLGFAAPRVLRAADDQYGDLVGRLVYDGTAPERKKVKVDKDVECCGKFDIREESLVVGQDGGLANAFVYLRTRKVEVCPELVESAPKQVKLDNKDCIFAPHCMTIWWNKQEFYIVNSDPVAQNVAFSPLGDVPANLVMAAAKGDAKVDASYKFARQQIVPVPIACNYHPWESAYILPRDNPYAAVSLADGAFRIAKLPVGKLEFQAWHERIGYLDLPDWPKGRFELAIKPGTNDLGTIKVAPARLVKS